ncbi:hypothetical protein Tco_0127040 [Tanacetum coccineum]
MSWHLRCSWCGGPFNGGNCRRCTNVSFGYEFVRNPDPISCDETPDFSYPPPQPQYETYSCELCGNDSHYGFDCPPQFPLCQPRNQNLYEPNLCYNSNSSGFDQPTQTSIDHQPPKEMSIRELLLQEKLHKALQAVCEKLNQQESTIPLNEITSQIPPIISVLSTLEPEDSPSMGDEHLSTIPKKKLDEFIKSSVEDLVSIPSESDDTSGSDSECNLPSCNDFTYINISEEKSVTFSNPLFDSNNDFTSSDDESLSDENVPEDNV